MAKIKMVDISEKPMVYREATAIGFIKLKPSTLRLIREGKIEKGDPLTTAKLAGILAAKQTPQVIPLTHPLPITGVDVETGMKKNGVEVRATVKTTYKTGCEVDAMLAASIALLTIFDCVKKYEKDKQGQYPLTTISDIRVSHKVKESAH